MPADSAPTWVVEALVGLNLTTVGAFGSFAFYYWRKKRAETVQQQHRIEAQLRVQGKLLNELAYSYTNLAEQLERDLDANVQTERIDDLHDLASECDSRWRDDRNDD